MVHISGITFIEHFLDRPATLFDNLRNTVAWDERMAARKTASYGKAYNYSQISYPYQAFTPALVGLVKQIDAVIGFEPNNCLINYYLDGKSRMGFHSDQTDILEEGTGVVIISVGENRTLRFRNIEDKTITKDFVLPSGSLIYMT